MARILTFCIRQRKSPTLWEDTEKEQVWIKVMDEESGCDEMEQVKLTEDGELLVEEIVKAFPEARGKELELFTCSSRLVSVPLDEQQRRFVANAKMNYMWQTRKDKCYYLEMRRRDRPPRPPPPRVNRGR